MTTWLPRENKSYPCVLCGAPFQAGSRKAWNRRHCYPCAERYRQYQSFACNMISRAVSSGKLPRATAFKCVDCGKRASEYEHRDYSKPLSVEPTCRRCNRLRGPGRIPEPHQDAEYSALKARTLSAIRAMKPEQVRHVRDLAGMVPQ